MSSTNKILSAPAGATFIRRQAERARRRIKFSTFLNVLQFASRSGELQNKGNRNYQAGRMQYSRNAGRLFPKRKQGWLASVNK